MRIHLCTCKMVRDLARVAVYQSITGFEYDRLVFSYAVLPTSKYMVPGMESIRS